MKKKFSLFERKFTVTKEQIKDVLGLTEEEFIELIEALEGEIKVRNYETVCLKITVEDVEQ